MIGLNHVMRATGHPKKAMLTSLTTVVCNIILAPIFIFQFGWGIRGAALATVISQFIGMLWVLNHFLQRSNPIRLRHGFQRMERRIVGSIFSIGMSPFLMNVTAWSRPAPLSSSSTTACNATGATWLSVPTASSTAC